MPMYTIKKSGVDIMEALEMYEAGASIAECCRWLGVHRCTFVDYLRGNLRHECYQEHLIKYPEGRVQNYGLF